MTHASKLLLETLDMRRTCRLETCDASYTVRNNASGEGTNVTWTRKGGRREDRSA